MTENNTNRETFVADLLTTSAIVFNDYKDFVEVAREPVSNHQYRITVKRIFDGKLFQTLHGLIAYHDSKQFEFVEVFEQKAEVTQYV